MKFWIKALILALILSFVCLAGFFVASFVSGNSMLLLIVSAILVTMGMGAGAVIGILMLLIGISIPIFIVGGTIYLFARSAKYTYSPEKGEDKAFLEKWEVKKKDMQIFDDFPMLKNEKILFPSCPCYIKVQGLGRASWTKNPSARDIIVTDKRIVLLDAFSKSVAKDNSFVFNLKLPEFEDAKPTFHTNGYVMRSISYAEDSVGGYLEIRGSGLWDRAYWIYHPKSKVMYELYSGRLKSKSII